MRSDISDEHSKTPGATNWSRMPGLMEFEAMASVVDPADFYGINELADSHARGRTQLYKL